MDSSALTLVSRAGGDGWSAGEAGVYILGVVARAVQTHLVAFEGRVDVPVTPDRLRARVTWRDGLSRCIVEETLRRACAARIPGEEVAIAIHESARNYSAAGWVELGLHHLPPPTAHTLGLEGCAGCASTDGTSPPRTASAQTCAVRETLSERWEGEHGETRADRLEAILDTHTLAPSPLPAYSWLRDAVTAGESVLCPAQTRTQTRAGSLAAAGGVLLGTRGDSEYESIEGDEGLGILAWTQQEGWELLRNCGL